MGVGECTRGAFFCAGEDNSQYIGLWSQALNCVLLEAADVCLDSDYGLSTVPTSAANNLRQTPADRRRGSKVRILISPGARVRLERRRRVGSPRERADVALPVFMQLCSALPESR